jgi:hypothetical protein
MSLYAENLYCRYFVIVGILSSGYCRQLALSLFCRHRNKVGRANFHRDYISAPIIQTRLGWCVDEQRSTWVMGKVASKVSPEVG